MDERIARLGAAVKRRRDELGLTQQEVAQAGGPSDTTQGGIEMGTARGVSPSTLRKLDSALRWRAGSARAVMEGGADPVPDETPAIDANELVERLLVLATEIGRLSDMIDEAAQDNPGLLPIVERAEAVARFARYAVAESGAGAITTGQSQSRRRTVRPRVPDITYLKDGTLDPIRVQLAPETDAHIDALADRKKRRDG
ncbi:helix-turn-helix domain-containing protein [Nocardia cyriacigeorgica]|uniref:helix-turn-helix domain-containing protein n=1 Tax=Nocardia cyriacigeorgica TaxID=135487 RepID=UPI002458543C|nr:helix-turn-helix transcriptional regulator [Nocardia cyriacigeorgica]